MKILVVEDEEKISRSLEKGLKAEGYIVDVALDGDSAEVMMNGRTYDLAIVDWMIPGKYDGQQLVQYWRSSSVATPVLMLTAKTSIGDRVGGLDSGADDYLIKPFSFDELLARARALLRRPEQNTGGVLKSRDVQIGTLAKEVTVAGKQMHLTAKEYQLLEYLMLHKGEVISKDQILDHVWADDERVQHNTVETFVANLRKKLGSKGNIIQTMRGHGYKVS